MTKTKRVRYISETRVFKKEDIGRMPMRCAWLDCWECYPIGQQPEGWRSLLTYPGLGKVTGTTCTLELAKLDVDAALCPKHVRELRRLLEIGVFDDLDQQPPKGNA